MFNLRRLPLFLVLASLLIGTAAYAQQAADFCRARLKATAVDLSSQVDDGFLKHMKRIGIKTVIRYYDLEDETFDGKSITPRERVLIKKHGFKLGVVFQHHSNRIASFTPRSGLRDAKRAVVMAHAMRQPRGSTIYFGVDNNWDSDHALNAVTRYFKVAKRVVTAGGYHVGVYGSGLVCDTIRGKNLAQKCWLSNAKSWPGYADYYRSQQWHMLQTREGVCAGHPVDFDIVNRRFADYGQFD
ncbi:glycoside hydrolase domain-containing protein [Methylovirgula sp. 4M-Z18]|uniref:glycoside hydrolase domain-containing protein n=1 Tax=Methylovirgula sp. 4M-Z18 TaxID=2293567 RepID=UPI000E2ED8C0|nr:glycoside hydrolase domain-containing protein [Methylovirgula sp. 4M-Z18]RFB81288.1 DUF1906 domain-containing protein [Methylovirgula sp. 4M-Z18]